VYKDLIFLIYGLFDLGTILWLLNWCTGDPRWSFLQIRALGAHVGGCGALCTGEVKRLFMLILQMGSESWCY